MGNNYKEELRFPLFLDNLRHDLGTVRADYVIKVYLILSQALQIKEIRPYCVHVEFFSAITLTHHP